MGGVASSVDNLQVAALPWRRCERGVEILLITTRHTRRWIVPKGWPEPGITPHECAAREAFEEAGAEGAVQIRPFGSFLYEKKRRSGDTVVCSVLVFPMEVSRSHEDWPEKGAREVRWCSIEEAQELVGNSGLVRLLVRFAKAVQTRRNRASLTAA